MTPSAALIEREQRHLACGVSEEAQQGGRVYASGRGTLLQDLEGRQVLDFAAGILTQSIGHAHPEVVAALQAQAEALWNVHDCATPRRAALLERLAALLPPQLNKFALLSTGAEAVEAALRAVWSAAAPGRQRLGALRYGFHGKSQGARSLVHWEVGQQPPAPSSVLAYAPHCYRCPLELNYPSCELRCAKLAARHIARANVAALVAEPVLGAAGVIVPPPGYWPLLQAACRAEGVLLVADEVLTGGGRCGSFLASTRLGLQPDLVTLAKGLASGFPFAVLAGPARLMDAGAFGAPGSSSSTFASNPLGIAAAGDTLTVIEREQLIDRVLALEGRLGEGLRALQAQHPRLGDVRGIGLLWGLEFVQDRASRTPDPALARAVAARCLDEGLRLLPGGAVLRLAPPFTVLESELSEALAILARVLRELGA